MNQHHLRDAMQTQGVDLVCSLPCGRMPELFFWLPEAFRHVGLTREEDGVGIAAGASMAGARPMLAIQSSGLGNMLNALLSLTAAYGLPLPILASWRGGPDEPIPAQVPFNRRLPDILAAADVPCTLVTAPGDHGRIGQAIAHAYTRRVPHVILLKPECFAWEGDRPGAPPARSGGSVAQTPGRDSPGGAPSMTRFEAIRAVASEAAGAALIATLGLPARELFAAGDRSLSFYMLGSYTQASAVGLGMALACPGRRVIVLDGDGSVLGSSILPVVAAAAPPNLTIVCLDNGLFGSTGNHPRPGLCTADVGGIARAAGIAEVWRVQDRSGLEAAVRASQGTLSFIHARLLPDVAPVGEVSLSLADIRDRFMEAVARPSSSQPS